MMAKRLIQMLNSAIKEFQADGGLRLAAALSYYAVFSLVPLLFVAVATAGYVFGDPDAIREVVDQATEVAGTEVSKSLEDLLATVQAQRGGALSIGVALSAFAAASIFQQIQAVLGVIFHIPEQKRRKGAVGWVIRRVSGIGSAIGLAILVLTPVAAVAGLDWVVGLLPDAADSLIPYLRLAIPLLSVLLLMLVTGLTFQALTAVEIPWRAALRGGATTALIGLSAAFLVGVYLSTAGTTGTLGALGGVAILLFFFNLMWAVYLYGAEVTKIYADYIRYGDIKQPSKRSPEDGIRQRDTSEAGVQGSETVPRTTAFAAGAALGILMGRRLRRQWFGARLLVASEVPVA